jgi:hypothetical protein
MYLLINKGQFKKTHSGIDTLAWLTVKVSDRILVVSFDLNGCKVIKNAEC